VRFLASGHAALGAATLVYLAAMALAAHRTHRAIVTTLALRHENAELVSGLVAEVEERRKAQKELEEALALSRATLDATADGILVANLAGQIVSMNRRFVEIWNVPDALLAEREVSIVRDYVVGQLKDPQAFLLRIRAIHRGNVEESCDVIEFRDGRRFESISVPHRVGDDVVGRVWTFHDVTEQGLRVRAEADNRAKDEFLAMLAHELRNPLGAISNAVRLLSRGADQDRTVAFAAGVIDRQSEQLKRLIDDLLEVSRVVSGKIGLKREPLDLLRAVQQVVQSLGAAGRTRGHRITVIGKPAWTNADAARIEQIVINLVVNALAYTPAGRAIEISVREEGGDVLLQVKDEGIGMTEETLARVFELFFQAEIRLVRPMGGLGIGLALVRRLVALHGGAVTAESDGPGTGSVFKVRLPAMPAPALVHPREGPAGETKRRRVLIVEDNDDGRESLKALLEAYGHEVHAASTGRSALSCMDAIEPEIAIIDLGLPDMNGYDLARTARERHGDRTTLIALTGYGLPEDEIRAYEAGFDAHLAKPADMRRLHALIQGGRALRRP
jgi:signal transduction histidine kinase/CheY-like chemotaxis protein